MTQDELAKKYDEKQRQLNANARAALDLLCEAIKNATNALDDADAMDRMSGKTSPIYACMLKLKEQTNPVFEMAIDFKENFLKE